MYDKIRANELTVALRPDPRLGLGDTERPLALTPPDSYSPTALGQAQALLKRKPIRLPRWYLGGTTVPQARRWGPYKDRRHRWFIVRPDDTITPD